MLEGGDAVKKERAEQGKGLGNSRVGGCGLIIQVNSVGLAETVT